MFNEWINKLLRFAHHFSSPVGNPCAEHPCEGEHICLLSSSAILGRTCKCADQLEEVRHKEINSSVCVSSTQCRLKCNQGKCRLDAQNQPQCECPIDFEGEFCERYRCSGYCQNHGICFVDATKRDSKNATLPPLKCNCADNWTGDRCELSASKCRDYCFNGATCTVTSNGTEACICPKGFFGDNCQNCDEMSCENQGVCVRDANGRASCQCREYFRGARCESSVCEGFCSGHGQCTIRLGSPQCECDVGFWGKQCQSDSCTDYCMNGGTCTINNANMMFCHCTNRFSGLRCEHEECIGAECDAVDPCEQIQCKNDGVCHVIDEKAICNCTIQYNGQFCEVKYG